MAARATGHVSLRRRKGGAVYYVKYRLPNGRQVQKLLGPAWDERGRPPSGYWTKATANARLREILVDADRGELAGAYAAPGKTFGDACAEWLRYVESEKQRSPSTLKDHRNVVRGSLLPEFGEHTPLERITSERIERFRERLLQDAELSRRTIQKVMVLLYGVLKRAKRRKWISVNPSEDVERVTVQRSGDFNVLTPVEVEAIVRSAADEQDAVIYTVAAFTGLRMGELRALRWGDVDFAKHLIHVRRNLTHGHERKPKSGKVRSVPLIDQAARALDGMSRREHFIHATDRVFCTDVGEAVDDGQLRDRFYDALRAAGLGRLREKDDPFVFHDLRHTFGTLAVQAWELPKVQGYMGHADIQTTMLYVHHQPKGSDANALTRLVEAAVGARDATGTPSRESATETRSADRQRKPH